MTYHPTLRNKWQRVIHFDIHFPTYSEAYNHAKEARSITKQIIGLRDYTDIVIIVGS